MPVRIDRLDLKSLKVLQALAQTRNTYRAAEQLHLSQSAVSRALARLREALDDAVFVRAPGGLEPTALTERLVSRLPEVMDMLADAVDESAGFDPVHMAGEVSIALGSHAMYSWAQDIYRALSEQAPRVTWNIRNWHPGSVRRILDGQLDFGLHFQNDAWEQSLYQQPVRQDSLVLMVRKGHPALRNSPGLAIFRQYGLVSLLIPDWNDYGNVLELKLRSLGIEPRVALRAESLDLALDCLASSDCVMVGNGALTAKQDGIVAMDCPVELEVEDLPVVMCYPRRMRDSVRYNWFAATIKAAIG